MLSLKTIVLAIIGFNVITITLLGINQFSSTQPTGRKAILQEILDDSFYSQETDETPQSGFLNEVIKSTSQDSTSVAPKDSSDSDKPEMTQLEKSEFEIAEPEVIESQEPELQVVELEVSGSEEVKSADSEPQVTEQAVVEVSPEASADEAVESEDSFYKFTDPAKALEILQQLDVFEEVGPKEISGVNYTSLAGGFTLNWNYCDEHRAYIVNHPELIFEGKNYVSNYWKWHKLRTQVIPSMEAIDLHPEVNPWHNPGVYKYPMRVDANIFYMFNLFYYKRQVGKQFSCLTQASNHIPGHDKMYRKDRVGQALVDYAKQYENRTECFNYNKWFPKTWVLQQKDQCLEFFAEFLSPRYQELKAERNIVYFRKIGANVHEGKGVFPVNNEEELKIQKLYKNGSLCGKITHNNLIQYNVHNLLLVKNRKFGFRSFLFVASTNPLIAYYHDGYARLSLNEYDSKSNEKKTFVTNIGVNMKEASKGTEFERLTPKEINERTAWTMQDFQDHVLEAGIVKDPEYLNNTLRPEFKKVMIHLLRMAQSGFFKKSSLFEVYGLDFVMDENLNLWFIEANTMPLVDGFTNKSTILLNRMLVDTFEIVMGLLKSRMKRIVHFVNLIANEVSGDEIASLPDLDIRREQFRELTENYFEPEFEVSKDNTYERIVYEKDFGTKRYSGLLTKECM